MVFDKNDIALYIAPYQSSYSCDLVSDAKQTKYGQLRSIIFDTEHNNKYRPR